MLMTYTLTETESANWAACATTRTAAKIDAFRRAYSAGRRFYQVQAASGAVLFVGEIKLTAR
jgi:hypothetical protein